MRATASVLVLQGLRVHDVDVRGLGEGLDELDAGEHLAIVLSSRHTVDGPDDGANVGTYTLPVLHELLHGLILANL